jgi:hypothetical protein
VTGFVFLSLVPICPAITAFRRIVLQGYIAIYISSVSADVFDDTELSILEYSHPYN